MTITFGRVDLPKNNKPVKIGEINSENPGDSPQKMTFANLLKPKIVNNKEERVPPKPVMMFDGESSITWKSSKIRSIIMQENLQYAIIGKFSYDKPDIIELQRSIPNQYSIKCECNIGILDSRHILIRLEEWEDYANLL